MSLNRTLRFIVLLTLIQVRVAPMYGQRLLDDITIQVQDRYLKMENSSVRLKFDLSNGDWLSLSKPNHELNLITPHDSIPEINFKLNNEWVTTKNNVVYDGYTYSLDANSTSVKLSLRYQIDHPQWGAFLLHQHFTLYPQSPVLERSASVQNLETQNQVGLLAFEDFRFHLPGMIIGDPDDCQLNVPGPWFPHSYIKPDAPYDSFEHREIPFMHSAPDGSFGLVCLTNETRNITLVSWMDTAGETNYTPDIQYIDQRIQLFFSDHRAYYLDSHQTVTSDVQKIILVSGGTSEVFEYYQDYATKVYPTDVVNPDWVRELIFLEVYPRYYEGGFKEITDRLPFYREIGFNAIYLMPHWLGGYSPIDLYQVDELFGTAEDLKAVVSQAHELGMKVFFDMVIHGFNPSSPFVQENKHMLVLDSLGQPSRYRTWKSVSTDWNNDQYIQYMADLARHHVKNYNIDGYRLDAASYKGPGWDTQLNYPAYKSGSNSPAVMRAMLEALREYKEEAMILNEVFGPVFYTVSNLAHDNQTEAVQHFLNMYDRGEVTIDDYKRHMASTRALLPEDANRVYFARNHDTSWFYNFEGYSPRLLNMDAIHSLCAIPLVFAGDRTRKQNESPDDNPATWEYYRKLFKVRQAIPELNSGILDLNGIYTNHQNVFTAVRRTKDVSYVILISFEDQALKIDLRLTDQESNRQLKRVYSVQNETEKKVNSLEDLTIAPYEVLILEMR